jgi:hypothetical protein
VTCLIVSISAVPTIIHVQFVWWKVFLHFIHCRLNIATLRLLQYSGDALFGMFDGHDNDEIPSLVIENIAGILQNAMLRYNVAAKFMKYTMLTMHRLYY